MPITRRQTIVQASLEESRDREVIIFKDEHKNIIDYDDNDETRVMRNRLRDWNVFAEENWIDVYIPDREAGEIYTNRRGRKKQWWDVNEKDDDPPYIDLTRKHLHRVFNNLSWDQGGRFYGGWWQHIASEKRRYITINWFPTRELDYSGLHINMLYHMRNEQPPSDPYQIEGVPIEYRPLVKHTLLTLMNVRIPTIATSDSDASRPPWCSAVRDGMIAVAGCPVDVIFLDFGQARAVAPDACGGTPRRARCDRYCARCGRGWRRRRWARRSAGGVPPRVRHGRVAQRESTTLTS